ncbi:MAG: AraC family transcriptional regulator [Pseudomonadota bacterium]
MDKTHLYKALDLLETPEPITRLPEFAHEVTLCGIRILALRPGPCSVRYRGDHHLINVELNGGLPFRVAFCSDREEERIHPQGGVMVLPAGTDMRLAGANHTTDLVMEVAPSVLDSLAGAPIDLQLQDYTPVPGAAAIAAQAVGCVMDGTPNRLLLEGLALAICGQVLEVSAPKLVQDSVPRNNTDRRIRRVREYIEDNLGEDLSVAALADVACLSVHHFARAFRGSFGETPHRYVQRRRIARATAMLSRTAAPISEIALDCGFATQSHFTAAFKSATGATPSAFRRQLKA